MYFKVRLRWKRWRTPWDALVYADIQCPRHFKEALTFATITDNHTLCTDAIIQPQVGQEPGEMARTQVLMNAVFSQGIPEARLLIKPLPQSRRLQDIMRLWAMMWRRELCANSNIWLNNLERYLHEAHAIEATMIISILRSDRTAVVRHLLDGPGLGLSLHTSGPQTPLSARSISVKV
jgi:hypothetical protein